MYRVSDLPRQAHSPLRGAICLIMAAQLLACTNPFETPKPDPKPVNCAQDCPCECKCDDPEDTADARKEPDPPSQRPYPVFLVGNVLITEGPLPVETARAQITTERIALEKCYTKAWDEDAGPTGELSLQFTVSAATGAVIAAVVRDRTAKAPDIERCFLSRIRKWGFDPLEKGGESVVRFDIYMSAVTFGKP